VPTVLAKEAATLDLLSDGRLELGIGAGWSGVEYTAMGLEFDRPGRRISKLEEVIELIKAHFDGSELAIGGEFVNVHGYAGRPRPVQRPHPPIIIGGGGRRVLGLAAREADIVSISNVPFVESNDAGLSRHEEARRRIGYVQAAAAERFDTLEVESSPYFTEITDDPGSALAELASKTRIPTEVLHDHPNVLIGSPATVADVLLSRRDELGVNYVTVQQSQAEAFAPVVSRLRGL
jgi:probable F420-dependent oxidoreductase